MIDKKKEKTNKDNIKIIDTLVFDEASITRPTVHSNPQWGDAVHTLSREAGRCVVFIKIEGVDDRLKRE